MGSHSVERRISGRGPVGPIPVQFRAPERGRGLTGGTRIRTVTEPGYIVDLSVSGAGVVVREIRGLPLRTNVEICHEGLVAAASVRRIVPRDDGRVLYGVDFTSLDPGIRDYLFGFIEARRPDALEQRWTRAH